MIFACGLLAKRKFGYKKQLLRIAKVIKNHKGPVVFGGDFNSWSKGKIRVMMQIIKEITESVVEKKLFMTSSSNVKFMAIINPEINPDLELTIDLKSTDDGYKIKNVSKFHDTVALKLSATYKIV